MSRTLYLRLGLILTVTGVLALVHRLIANSTRVSPGVELAIALALIVVGLPLLLLGLRRDG